MAISHQPDSSAGMHGPPRKLRGYRRGLTITTVVAVVLLAVSALVFTVSNGTRNITEHAEGLHITDESMRAATVARAQLGFVNHLAAVERELGTDVSAPLEQSSLQATEAMAQLQIGTDRLADRGVADLQPAVAAFADTGNEVLALIDSGESLEANELVSGELQNRFEDMFDLLETVQAAELDQVESADAWFATLGDIARFLVVFLIPMTVIIVYREIVRRQQRSAELEMRLKAERDIGAAREDFIANASHEFRTPLTGIYGLSQLIEDDADAPPAVKEYASIISSESADLTRMVEDLLTAARLESDAITFMNEDVDTEETKAEVLGPFNRSGTKVIADVVPAVARVDRLRQRQVLRNLISNAIKYGGPTIELVGRIKGTSYEWVVKDDGEGVPEELVDKLFQRFVHRGTTVVVPGGVGLGLSIVRALAEGMGGTVTYRRRSGWSEFAVQVPLAESQPGLVARDSGPITSAAQVSRWQGPDA